MLTGLISTIITVFIISFLVFIHELGHFLAARAVGVKVNEFSIGFGPKIFSWEGKETKYSLRWILLGGYVQMLGDSDPSSMKPDMSTINDPKSYLSKPPWAKIMITVAGVFVNFVFGAIAFMFILSATANSASLQKFGNYNFIGGETIPLQVILTDDFREEAESFGIIKYLDGKSFSTTEELQEFLVENENELVEVTLLTAEGESTDTLILNGDGFASNLDLDFFQISSDIEDKAGQDIISTRLLITGISEGASFASGQIGDRTFDYTSGSNEVINNIDEIKGQYILAINEQQILSATDLTNILNENLGESVTIDTVAENGNTSRIAVNLPSEDDVEQGQILGISFAGVTPAVIPGVVTVVYPNSFIGGVMHAINIGGYNAYTLVYFIGQAISGDATLLRNNAGSVIRIGEEVNTAISQEGIDLGVQALGLLNLAAFISVILAFMNILPLPILDGGNLVLIIFEWITGKKIPESILNKIFAIFFLFFIILSILLVGWDTFRLFFN